MEYKCQQQRFESRQKRRWARRKQSFCNRYSHRRNLYAYDLYRKKISKSIAVTRQPKGFTSETVYYDNLDKAIWSGSGNPFIDQWDGYINATGTGAENIEYTGRTVSVRNNFQSSGYAGASRKNAFYFGGKDAYVTVNNIQLPISKYISAETEVR